MKHPRAAKQDVWTVRELIDWLSKYPPEAEVWMATGLHLSSPITEIWPLNGGSNVLLDNPSAWETQRPELQ